MWRGTLNYVLWNHNQNRWPSRVGLSGNKQKRKSRLLSRREPHINTGSCQQCKLPWQLGWIDLNLLTQQRSKHLYFLLIENDNSSITTPAHLQTRLNRGLITADVRSLHDSSLKTQKPSPFSILDLCFAHFKQDIKGILGVRTFSLLGNLYNAWTGKWQLPTLIKMISALIASLPINIAFWGVFHLNTTNTEDSCNMLLHNSWTANQRYFLWYKK